MPAVRQHQGWELFTQLLFNRTNGAGRTQSRILAARCFMPRYCCLTSIFIYLLAKRYVGENFDSQLACFKKRCNYMLLCCILLWWPGAKKREGRKENKNAGREHMNLDTFLFSIHSPQYTSSQLSALKNHTYQMWNRKIVHPQGYQDIFLDKK